MNLAEVFEISIESLFIKKGTLSGKGVLVIILKIKNYLAPLI